MPVVPISLLIDKTLVAKTNVNGYASDFKTVKYSFVKNGLIGKIFSYVTDKTNGKLYFMVYVTNSDYNNFNPTYFLINDKQLSITELPNIIKKIEADKKAEQDKIDRENKGLLGYYIEKYMPVILLVGLSAYALPKLINSNNGNAKK